MHSLLIPRYEKERYKDAICQSTAVANHVDPKSDTTTVIAMELWKGSAKGESPKTFAICQGPDWKFFEYQLFLTISKF